MEDEFNKLFIEQAKSKIYFKSFTEFCIRAKEILKTFKYLIENNYISLLEIKNYIYYKHKFSDTFERNMLCKDKCWEWLMSYKYEEMNINDLWSILHQIKKGD